VLQSPAKIVAFAVLRDKTPGTCWYRRRESTWYPKC